MQKLKVLGFSLLFTTLSAVAGHNGIPGCDGGTKPSADGKYYKPDTHELCNPGHVKRNGKMKYSDRRVGEVAI